MSRETLQGPKFSYQDSCCSSLVKLLFTSLAATLNIYNSLLAFNIQY
uniref:Uncharacterized protein n=1 Tax=Anguilla anguilla TaxID=7936 RepID=A0A0E9PUF8_ANGAN